MRSSLVLLSFALQTFAARPFLNEPDTGFDPFVPEYGTLPNLTDLWSLPDFQAAARNFLNITTYSYYRNGAAGEWSYRNNLESFGRIRFRPRVLRDILKVNESLPTSILGYNYSVPFFITSTGRAGLGNSEAEKNYMRAGEKNNVLYVTSWGSTLPLEEIVAAKTPNSTYATFSQLYLNNNDDDTVKAVRRIEAAGQKAIVLTVDSAGDGDRARAFRYNIGSNDKNPTYLTWERIARIKAMTKLPLVLKGIGSVEDAKMAVEAGVAGIYLSNHGGRQLDYSPAPFEVALDIHREAPEIFQQIDVWADGGVRYGADVLKLLALGVKAVGLGRPFAFANVYGEEGISRVISLLKTELLNDLANLGVPDLKQIDPSVLKLDYANTNGWYS